MNKISYWLKNRKLVLRSWKDYALLAIFLIWFKKQIMYAGLLVMGIALAPLDNNQTVKLQSVIDGLSVKISSLYANALTGLIEAGISIGEAVAPYNIFLSWFIMVIIALILLSTFVWSIFSLITIYQDKKNKENDKND